MQYNTRLSLNIDLFRGDLGAVPSPPPMSAQNRILTTGWPSASSWLHIRARWRPDVHTGDQSAIHEAARGTLIHGVQKTLTVQASSALARAPQKAVVTNCFVSAGAVVSTPVYHPHTPFSSYCMFLPALFETTQQLKGTGRMSAMLCSPVSLQVVQ